MKSAHPSLYPLKIYTKYLGKPLYRTARKLGLSKGLALDVAHFPGSVMHALPAAAAGEPYLGLSLMVMGYCVFPTIMKQNHETNREMRESSLRENLVESPMSPSINNS